MPNTELSGKAEWVWCFSVKMQPSIRALLPLPPAQEGTLRGGVHGYPGVSRGGPIHLCLQEVYQMTLLNAKVSVS